MANDSALELALQAMAGYLKRRADEPGPAQAGLRTVTDVLRNQGRQESRGGRSIARIEERLSALLDDPKDTPEGALLAALGAAREELPWNQPASYRDDPRLDHFMANYAFVQMVGSQFDAMPVPWPNTRIRLGITLQGPNTYYPPHNHPAEEIYIVLAGAGAWRQGEQPWRERPPGSIIFHSSLEPHAMRTGGAPLLALFAWAGGDIEQGPAMTDHDWEEGSPRHE